MTAIARWCYGHRFVVLGMWLAALVGLGVVNAAVGTGYNDNFALPGTESTKALSLLQSAFPAQAGESDTIVWRVNQGSVRDASVQGPITAMLDKVAQGHSVAGVTSPYSPQGGAPISKDGHHAH